MIPQNDFPWHYCLFLPRLLHRRPHRHHSHRLRPHRSKYYEREKDVIH